MIKISRGKDPDGTRTVRIECKFDLSGLIIVVTAVAIGWLLLRMARQ